MISLEKLNVIVEYIYHSCFIVKLNRKTLVFDYYRGEINLKDKDIYVFASHNHKDHFNPKVLNWEKNYENVYYIFSNDIKVDKEKNILFMAPYKEKTIRDLKIKTFGSTDQGVSFCVSVDDINIFHAGDLNWWYWDDDTDLEKINMENSFKIKIKRLKESDIDIDIAFFPVDPRLSDYFHLGGEYFINEIRPKYFFPMHSWGKYAIYKKFIQKLNNNGTKIMDIQHKNQIFEL